VAIARSCRRREPDANSTRRPDFGQGIHRTPKALQRRLPPAAVDHGIDVAFICFIVKQRAAGSEAVVISGRDRAAQQPFSSGSGWSADVVRAGSFQRFQASSDIIRRVLRMPRPCGPRCPHKKLELRHSVRSRRFGPGCRSHGFAAEPWHILAGPHVCRPRSFHRQLGSPSPFRPVCCARAESRKERTSLASLRQATMAETITRTSRLPQAPKLEPDLDTRPKCAPPPVSALPRP